MSAGRPGVPSTTITPPPTTSARVDRNPGGMIAPSMMRDRTVAVIGPHISNRATPNATEMDQNGNTVAGQPGSTLIGGPAGQGDAALGFFDIVGLRVLSITPSSPTQSPPGLTSVTITFNEPVASSNAQTRSM